MDIPFLKLMADAYVSDSINDLNVNEITECVLTTFGKFKIAYPETAKELYLKSRSFQQDLIYSFLDNKYSIREDSENEYVDESLREKFNEVRQKLAKIIWSTSQTPEQEFMLTLVDKNYNNCNKQCSSNINLTPNIINDLLYINPKSNSLHRGSNELTKLKSKYPEFNENLVGRCLRFCYLDYMTSIYAEGILSFETCTKKLGGNEITISNYSDMLKNYPISGMCNEIYIALNDLYKEIDKLLDYIYLQDSFKKKKWVDVIFLKLDAARKGRSYKIDFSKIDDEFEYPTDYVRVV